MGQIVSPLILKLVALVTIIQVALRACSALIGQDIPGLETVGNICGDTETSDSSHWGAVESTLADSILRGQIEWIAVSFGGAIDPIWPKFRWLQSFEIKYTNFKTPILHGTIRADTRQLLALDVMAGEYLTEIDVQCGKPVHDHKHVFDPKSTFVVGFLAQTSWNRQIRIGDKSVDHTYAKSYGKRIIAFHGANSPVSNLGLNKRKWITALGVQFADIQFGKWPKVVPEKALDLSKRLQGPDYRNEKNAKKVEINHAIMGYGGFVWDDFNQTTTQSHNRIGRIEARCYERVDQLTFYYRDNRHPPASWYPGFSHGGLHGTFYAGITLDVDEFITTAIVDGGRHYHEQFTNPNWRYRLGYLELITSKNQRFVCGTKTIDTYTYSFNGRAILAFYGRANKNVDALGIYTIPVADY